MDYKIELAKVEDIEDIRKLIYDRCIWFSKKGIKGWHPNYYPDKYNFDYFNQQLQNNKLFVAKKDDVVCGAMLLKSEDLQFWNDNSSSYFIHHLVTDINSKGIGQLLLNFAIEQCKKDKKEYLRLDCYKTSIFLNEYYEKIGFKKVATGRTGNYYYNLWEMKI